MLACVSESLFFERETIPVDRPMESVAPFLAYVVALGIAAAIPGPGVVAVIGRALGAGVKSSLPFIVGLAMGDILFLTVAVVGLSAMAAAASGVFVVVKVAGGLYLMYLAWQFWTAKIEQTHVHKTVTQSAWVAAVSGFAVTLGNPKTIVFYLALLPNVLDLAEVGLMDWLVLSVLTLAVLLAVLTPYAVLAARLRITLTRPSSLRRLNRSAATLIGGAGGLILNDAIASPAK